MYAIRSYYGSYKTNLFGKDLNKTPIEDQRPFIANHRSLGYLKNDQFLVLETQSVITSYSIHYTKLYEPAL